MPTWLSAQASKIPSASQISSSAASTSQVSTGGIHQWPRQLLLYLKFAFFLNRPGRSISRSQKLSAPIGKRTVAEIGRAHVSPPVPNAHLGSRLLLANKIPTT